jgi:two-component system response regulator FixJ
MTELQTVSVVDDCPEMLRSICEFLGMAGFRSEGFTSAEEFIASFHPDMAGCLVLDLHLPKMSGLQLQEFLKSKGSLIPVIIISGRADVRDAVKAMKLGSLEVVEKPFAPESLLSLVREALTSDNQRRREDQRRNISRERFAKLSKREREILARVISGKPSKQIADAMKLSVSTVDNHRANIMKKLKAETSADLTRLTLMMDPALAFSGLD